MSDNLIKRIMRKKEVLGLVGVSDTTLWRWEREGVFPKRRKLGGNSVGWMSDEIQEFLNDIAGTPEPAVCNAYKYNIALSEGLRPRPREEASHE